RRSGPSFVLAGISLASRSPRGGQMKRSLLISVAALACACGGSPQSDHRDASAPAGSAQAGTPGSAAQTAGGDQGGATRVNQTVTLVGCLLGPTQPAAPTG